VRSSDTPADGGFLASPLRAGAVVAFIAFGVYLVTLAPGLTFIDSGELAAVACTLGIAHPTGYPLFTLMGWLFSHLPVPGEEIFRLNLMAATFCAAGVFIFFQLMVQLFSLTAEEPTKGEARKARDLLAAGGASLVLAFSETYWAQATAVEVYSLHVLLLSLVLLCFFRAYQASLSSVQDDQAREHPEGRWLAFAFLTGLAFTNHMTTILLAPALLYLFLSLHGFQVGTARLLVRMAVLFLLGLSLYLYLPLRGNQEPLFNWGDPVTLDRFLSHLRGKQYSIWIFSSAETASRQFAYFAQNLPGEFALVGVLFAAPGLLHLFRHEKRLFRVTIILFLTCVIYSINYDIHDIDSYFLLAYFVVAIWSGFGIASLLKWKRVRTARPVLVGTGVIACSLVSLIVHFSDRDESRNFLVEDYTANMFRSIDRNGLVLSYQWDFWVSGSYYSQYVESLRPDVTVVDKELLRRSWYLKELEGRYPWLITRSRREVDAFLPELRRFEEGRPYDPRVIQSRFEDMILSFFLNNPERPLYVTHEIEPEFTRGFERIPTGLAFRLSTSPEFQPTDFPEIEYRPFGRRGRLEDAIRRFYADAYTARGIYYSVKGGDQAEARASFTRALGFDPAAEKARQWLTKLGE